jgi:hypothetical protein
MSGSFFGFETSLPRSDNYSTLDERLAEQDLEIYDFNTDSYNNLLISEEDDNYNLDTFGEDPIATVTTQQSVGTLNRSPFFTTCSHLTFLTLPR